MTRFAKIIVCALILMFSFSCKKEPVPYYVSDAFKRWTVFGNGSYWIFINDSTLLIDSVFYKEPPRFLEIPPYSSKDGFSLERIEMSYNSAFLSSSEIILYEGGMEILNILLHNEDFSMVPLIASASDNFVPYYDKISGGYYQILSQNSTFYLGQAKFDHVVSTQFSEGEKKWTCWFARDIGLIKITSENTNSDFSWSLLRYHIVK